MKSGRRGFFGTLFGIAGVGVFASGGEVSATASPVGSARDPFEGKIHPKCEGGPAGLAYINGEYVPCPKCGGSQICEGVYCHPDDRKRG